jgi:hypothetical protein
MACCDDSRLQNGARSWAALGLSLWLLGCSRDLVVVKQAEPNALESAPRFVLAPLVLEGAHIDGSSEAEYAQAHTEDDVASYADDKASMQRTFEIVLLTEASVAPFSVDTTKPKAAAFLISPRLESVTPGGGLLSSADVAIRVQIQNPDGSLIDEVVVRGDSETEDPEGQAIGQAMFLGNPFGVVRESPERRSRMNKATARAARVLVDYLIDRTRP